jgi:hypothetical protein
VFYRKGVRFVEKTGEAIPVEECAHNIAADNLEAIHKRMAMMQKEIGHLKSISAVGTLVSVGLEETSTYIKMLERIEALPPNTIPKGTQLRTIEGGNKEGDT